MPIITGAVVAPPIPPGATFPPRVDIGAAFATYYDPTGEAWPLTDPQRGWFTPDGAVEGIGAAPVEFATDPYPRGGARLRHIQPLDRTIRWGLHIWGASHQEMVERWRALARAFTATHRLGPGLLEIARPDGGRRQIPVYYREGFGNLAQDGYHRTDEAVALSLWCEDPYWTDPTPVTAHREYGGGVDYLNPYPSISSGQVLGATTLTNTGDVIAWPTWTVTGPASAVTMTNNTTGRTFTLNPNNVGHGNLLTGQQVTVRTDPIQVRYQTGAVWTGALNWPAAQVWGLEPGDNDVTFTLTGSGPGSAVDLTYMARYETA